MARAAALYEEPLRAAIHALKYEGRTALAGPLARYLAATLRRDDWLPIVPSIDAIVPVPLHAQRLAQRGYNQSELLSTELCARTGIRHEPSWIARHKETRPQVGLGAAQRRANVDASFTATRSLHGANLLLIDDVYTTGATLTACALAARDAGAAAVYALTLARPLLLPGSGPLP